jgi:tetratricopeptide (TPR) repeat protein
MQYKIAPPELTVNGLGYFEMSNKRFTAAAALFRMNIDNYPNSSNVYDSYGDLLTAEKDTLNAIVNYKKALSLQDNAGTKQKLNALEGKEIFKLTGQELQKYTGVFDMDSISLAITMQVKNDELWAAVPGQGDFQLIPVAPNTFTVKNISGYEVHFQMDGDKVVGFTSIQPNGTFKAHLRK